jgi:hypothetical protein
MKYFQRALLACLLGSLCFGAFGAEKSKIDYSKAIKVPISEDRLSDLKKSIILRRALLVPLPDPNCTYQSGGVCPIDIPVLLLPDPQDATKIYCVAVFPELVVLPGSGPSAPEKTIVWSLTGPASPPPNATFTFYNEKDHGIILLQDIHKQMHGGTLGDGTTSTVDPTKYMFKNKNKISKAESVYLPIVVRTDNVGTAQEKVSVCGTPDPRIAND